MRAHEVVYGLALLARVGAGHALPTKLVASQTLDIVGLDYAFRIPREIKAGQSSIGFVNSGKVAHELNISLLKSGATVQQFMDAVQADKSVKEFSEGPVGVLFAEPGKRATARLSTNLLPGRTYVVICINRDSPTAKPHYSLGMFSAFTPEPSRSASTSPSRVDTITATEYAYRYPRELEAGRHTFVFVNAGKVRHEALLLLLKKGVTVQQAVETQKAGGNVDALIDDALGVLHAAGGTVPFGALELDLLPGRTYAVICTFSDDPKSPPHLMLGMVGSIETKR
jgi:hypothetical protein